MNPTTESNFQNYLRNEKHPDFLEEAQKIAHDPAELEERFSSSLEFGTGGLRGIIGAGTSRINAYTVSRSSQGLASYALGCDTGKDLCAVVSYDSRLYSPDFAREAALVFCANNIKTYLFSSLHPVPSLSFAVRHYQACFGVMITASHNPPIYNGYKVYWGDGAQVLPPHDHGIIAEIERVNQIKHLDIETAKKQGLLIEIGTEIDTLYQEAIAPLIRRSQLIHSLKDTFSLVYTPLHGSGFVPVTDALKKHGFHYHVVDSQAKPDGHFPTVKSPNPEDPAALEQAVQLAKSCGAQLVMATDPDADRLGIAVLHEQNFRLLTGNQMGAILFDYLVQRHLEMHSMPSAPFFVNTIVSSRLHNEIAQAHNITSYRVLTGFKYIAEKIAQFEKDSPQKTFIFGCEESYGFLCTTLIRDKDAVSTALVLAECALWHHAQGRTLVDALENLYKQFGFFEELQVSVEFPGNAGKSVMANLMAKLREQDKNLFYENVKIFVDYKDGIPELGLPASNVLEFELTSGSTIIARPSGTEPKLKFYILAKGNQRAELSLAIEKIQADIKKIIAEFQ